MKKITLKDIANELNVTVGTVSHALNGLNDISEETKKRVFDTAKRLGYISNNSAVSLRSGRTNTIAVIVPDISNPHIAHQIKLIDDKIKQINYSVIILNTDENEDAEYNAIVTACSKQVDGIMLCPAQHSVKNTEFLKKLGIPYILIGRYFSDFEFDYVCADDFKGGYIAGEYLIKNGYKKPIYFGAYKYIEPSLNRFNGLKAAFAKNNISINDRFIQISPKPENIGNAVEEIHESGIEFDSVVAFSDLLAFEIMGKIQKLYETQIPIIGFDAINTHLHLPFPNISVGMADNGWANKASAILLEKINGSKKTYKELIDVKLFEVQK